ncbi:protein SIEVE ELEMENT OCCLUSION B-like [Chenopodium quinoa]|uniref:Protein SIEVE ELEMENT OCCLUSION B-like n=1 Tax=Chenopodium quinoa TaxID=63459 RepID=A0A803KQC6_CHEQI|nr:protein SIEVE ELEMENT OCCLUSION B-like [Chenopodium quinoa]
MSSAPSHRQMARSERRMFAASDDSTMLKQIQGTHAPDGRDVDVRPILEIIEDVFQRAAPSIPGAHIESLDDKTGAAVVDENGMLEALAFVIQKVSCEITCKCAGGGDAHATTMALLSLLSSYSWDAKVAIALTALAIAYGEFGLVVQLFSSHPLAKSVAVLKQLPDVMEHSNALKSRFEALNNLIGAMLDVTKRIVEFRQLPQQYISAEQRPLSVAMTHIPTAAYWTIRSVVACATQIFSLIGMSYEYVTSTTEAWELSSLAHKERNIHDHLMQQLALCYQHIDEKKHIEAYNNLVRILDLPQLDNTRILRHLIYLKDDMMPLYEKPTNSRVHVEALRRKTVLLLISDFDVTEEELMILNQIYRKSRSKPELQYEIVWIPIIDKTVPWSDALQQRFEQLESMMSWYTLHHPKIMEPAAIRYIREVWNFEKKMILVTLDPQGKVVCQNALHMYLIWGNIAYPFTTMKEEALWRDESWTLELFVDDIKPEILDWAHEGRYVCVYGGEDMEWIKRFTHTAKEVAAAAGITLELVYAGKSNAKERMRKIVTTIDRDGLSHYLPDLNSMWYFWIRLECMLYSKMQHGKGVESDPIMQEVMTVLSFDGSDQGWATMWFGLTDMARSKGDTILDCLMMFEDWKENASRIGFLPALKEHLQALHTPHHCNRLILPGVGGGIPERVVCAECGRPMEKYFMYRCCTD